MLQHVLRVARAELASRVEDVFARGLARGAEAKAPSVVAKSISRSQKSCNAPGATPAVTRAARDSPQETSHLHVFRAY